MNSDRSTSGTQRIGAAVLILLGLLAHAPLYAQGAGATAPPAASTTASVGLLPVHAIAVDFNALPGLSDKQRGKPEEITAMQQLWDGYLKSAGFNVIEFEVDVRELGETGAGRLARMCTWAKQNNVRIAPTLVGAPEGKPLPADYAQLAAAFVGKVIATLGPAGGPAYSQIVFYRLDRPLNQPASHGAMEPEAAMAILKAAAESVRAAETAGLAASGVQATPLLVPSSFDYELIRRGAIAQTAITDESYLQAYAGLRDYLTAVLGAAAVEAASVEWYPGSLSAGGVDRLTDLVNRLQSDLPGKLLILDTGYSTAASSDTAQARYYQVALGNLCSLRADQGVDSPFAGILWRSAMDAGGAEGAAEAKPPGASEVTTMWNDPKAESREARSWVSRVRSQFGLLARAKSGSASVAPKTAFRVMSQLEASLAQSPQTADALAAVKELGEAAQTGTLGTTVKSRLQGALFGMLDAWLTKTADNLFAEPQESQPTQAGGTAAPRPDVQVVGIGALPAKVTVGTRVSVPVTLFNAGNTVATDATVYLRDLKNNDLARTNPMSISPGGQTSVELAWTPGTGTVQGIVAEAFCINDADPSSNRVELGDLQVDSGGKKPPRFDVINAGILATSTKFVMQSSSTPSSAPPSSGGTAAPSTSMMLSTSSAMGFATIEGLSAPKVMMAASPTSGPAGGTAGGTRSVTSSSSAPPPPPAEPVTMTLANPFRTLFRDVVATLRVDDKVVSTRTLGTLMPGQQRTVTFTEWSPKRAGTYRLRADLNGVGVGNKPLTSSATSTITVEASGATARSAPAPAAPTQVRSLSATRSVAPLVRPASAQPVRGLGAGPRSMTGTPRVRSMSAHSPIALTANSIVLRPFPPSPGMPVSVAVQLANLERMPVQGARVSVSVDGAPLGDVTIDVPASGVAMASGFKDWPATAGAHEVRASVRVGASESAAAKPMFVGTPGDRGFGRPGMATGGTMVAGGPRGMGAPETIGGPRFGKPGGMKPTLGGRGGDGPDLRVTPADVRFTPASPTANSAMSVTITVHNAGSATATDGRVLAVLSAAGVEVARKQFPAMVPAKGMTLIEWPLTAPANGPLMVTVTASAAGDADLSNNQTRATAGGGVRKPPARGPGGAK